MVLVDSFPNSSSSLIDRLKDLDNNNQEEASIVEAFKACLTTLQRAGTDHYRLVWLAGITRKHFISVDEFSMQEHRSHGPIYLPAGRIGPGDATFDHCCGYSKDGTYYKGVEIPVDPNADLPPEWGQPFSPGPHPLPQLAPEPEPEP
eukprot:jgi/Psemu1/57245/gm1.57245_g